MSITVDCFFKFLMCSCRAYIAGTATIDASSGHLKCWNWLALFAECNGNSVSFWRWSFNHFIWPSVIFPPSCHFFRSPISIHGFKNLPSFSATCWICSGSFWYAAARLVTSMTWYVEDFLERPFLEMHQHFSPSFTNLNWWGLLSWTFWWNLHLSVVPDIIKMLEHLAWSGMPLLPNQGGWEEYAQTFWRYAQTSLKTSGQHPHGCGQPLEMEV